MKLSKLSKRIERQARRGRRSGSMTIQEVAACMVAAKDPQALKKINEHLEVELMLAGADWRTWFRNLWDAIQANWPSILAFIIKLLPLLLLDNKIYNSENPDENR